MLGHAIALSGMFSAATALLLYSLSLPPEDPANPIVVVNATPEPVVTASATPSDASGNTGDQNAQPTAVPKPTSTPTPVPTPTPTPSPGEEALLGSFTIAATSPQSVLRQAQVHAGRVDPFKSVQPPDLPDFEPAVTADQLAFVPALPANNTGTSTGSPTVVLDTSGIPSTPTTPAPRPLTYGLALKGILDGGIDPIAIIEINGRTELFRVGERLPGNIRVTSINYEQRRVTLSRGQATGTLYLPEPNSPNF